MALSATAFGALRPEDGRKDKDFPAEKLLLLPEEKEAILGDKPAAPEFDLLAAAGMPRDRSLQALRSAALKATAFSMRRDVGRDYLLIQAVEALDSLNVILNSLSVRLRELWGVHDPELSAATAENERFVKAVAAGTAQTAGSVGMPLQPEDSELFRALAERILALYREKEALESYVSSLAAQVAPKCSAACGGSLAARLISRAGSLARIAYMPSSTVQVLGAEKALFKHLTRGTPCPKHGLIFQHPDIQSARREERGKLARRLAAKISIAVRVDYFSAKKP